MHKVIDIFPTPIYVAKRETELTDSEIEDIKDLTKKEKWREETGAMGQTSAGEKKFLVQRTKDNTYIFDTKLDSLKKFCEEHIDTYVNEVIRPKNLELEFYITQSWLSVVEPGYDFMSAHSHPNSLISGVFYASTVEGDAIQFYDINTSAKTIINIEPGTGKTNLWNVTQQNLNIENNVLLLFPSYLGHGVKQNVSKISDRISIAFNVFVKGNIGEYHDSSKLNLR